MTETKNKIFFFILSFSLHGLIIFLLFFNPKPQETQKWSGGQSLELEPIYISLETKSLAQKEFSKNDGLKTPVSTESFSRKTIKKSGTGSSTTPREGKGLGLDEQGVSSKTAPHVIAKIRKKIAREQVYPLEAQEGKIEGDVKVSFKIKEDGDLSFIKILQSSGSPLLDQAALQTIKKAAPLPFYPDVLALKLEYKLKENL